MAYTIPKHVLDGAPGDPAIRYRWDDWKASDEFQYDVGEIVGKLAKVTLRARIVFGIGVYEWIIGRFQAISDDRVPLLVAEAVWCAAVHRAYVENTEFNRREWMGPIRGPLWCAMTWLVPMVLCGDSDLEECESGLAYLPRLVMHVLPKPQAFQLWMDQSMERLAKHHTAPPDDPLEDLFSEREEERRGPLVAREILDPNFDYRPEMAQELMGKYLRGVNYQKNPFLHSPEQMKQEGFEGTPYSDIGGR